MFLDGSNDLRGGFFRARVRQFLKLRVTLVGIDVRIFAACSASNVGLNATGVHATDVDVAAVHLLAQGFSVATHSKFCRIVSRLSGRGKQAKYRRNIH